MKKIENYENIRDFSDVSLPVGPQPCKITDVIDHPDKSYLEVRFDIDSGEFKGFYKNMFEKNGSWRGTIIRSYKESALGFFKAFITAVEKSNTNYSWLANDWNEKSLIGKYVIVNFREEEYLAENNEIKTSIKPFEFRSIQAWKEGKIQTPKKLEIERNTITESSTLPDISDEDVPW